MTNGIGGTKWEIYIAGAGAGALTSLLDFLKDVNNGTIARIGTVLDKHLFPDLELFLGANFWAIVLVVVVTLFVCWIYEAQTKLDGFLRGCTILAAFSIGAPGPIIEKQLESLPAGTSNMLLEQPGVQNFAGVISPARAFARDAHAATTSGAPVGEAYIVLTHLSGQSPPPRSTVEVKGSGRQRVALFQVKGDNFFIRQPYGSYLVTVTTPGFTAFRFKVKINRPLWAYTVDTKKSSVPIAFQKLTTPSTVKARSNEAEAYKQIGRQRALKKDFEGALINYKRSLEEGPDDPQTLNFKGYALYRLSRFDKAEQVLRQGLERAPDDRLLLLNLAKAQCGRGHFDAAKLTLNESALTQHKNMLRNESELLRVCGPIVGTLEAIAGVDYYVAVSAFRNKDSAIAEAKSLRDKGYDAEVHFSTSGFYGVTLGRTDAAQAQLLLNEARSAGDVSADAYLTDGHRFTEKVFPN
jgi:hypothetical protein